MSERRAMTDDEINHIVAKQTRPLRALIGELEAKLAAHERVKVELTAAATALTVERDAATSALTTAKQQHATATAAARAAAIQVQLTFALLGANLLPAAADVATRELARAASIDTDESGLIRSIAIGETEYADPAAAAKAWLEARPYFVRASGGGSGTVNPAFSHSGSGWRVPGQATEMSAADLMKQGLQEPPR